MGNVGKPWRRVQVYFQLHRRQFFVMSWGTPILFTNFSNSNVTFFLKASLMQYKYLHQIVNLTVNCRHKAELTTHFIHQLCFKFMNVFSKALNQL